MITIDYDKNSIVVTGHANYADNGKDIVCAGVSAIVMGAINWFNDEDIVLSIDNTRKIELSLINKTKSNQEKINLILIQLKSIELKYKKNIKFKKGV